MLRMSTTLSSGDIIPSQESCPGPDSFRDLLDLNDPLGEGTTSSPTLLKNLTRPSQKGTQASDQLITTCRKSITCQAWSLSSYRRPASYAWHVDLHYTPSLRWLACPISEERLLPLKQCSCARPFRSGYAAELYARASRICKRALGAGHHAARGHASCTRPHSKSSCWLALRIFTAHQRNTICPICPYTRITRSFAVQYTIHQPHTSSTFLRGEVAPLSQH
jgi:hypothetical protein